MADVCAAKHSRQAFRDGTLPRPTVSNSKCHHGSPFGAAWYESVFDVCNPRASRLDMGFLNRDRDQRFTRITSSYIYGPFYERSKVIKDGNDVGVDERWVTKYLSDQRKDRNWPSGRWAC